MPTYEYQCPDCKHDFEKVMPISKYAEVGAQQECPECGGKPARRVVSSGAGFILKGDGWAGKDHKINRQMAKKNQRLDARQAARQRDQPSVKLAPNVEGERTESWSDAAKLAKSKGKNTSGYDKRASSENKT